MKKKGKIIIVIIVALTITGFFIIKNLTETGGGKIGTYVAMNLQLDKILNPKSIDIKSIKEIREKLNRESRRLSKEPIAFSNIKDINIEVNSEKIPVRIYTPGTGEKFPIIIYSHGGSWVAGNLDSCDSLCRKLSKNIKAIVISVGYHLAPENPFPAGFNDVYNVLLWANKNAKSINGNEKLIAVAGDSAGGNLSAAVSLKARDKNGPHITCQVLIYPSTNIYKLESKSWSNFANHFNISTEEMQQYISLYVPKKEERKNPYASPLLAKDFKRLPHTLVITAEIDPLRDEGETFANKLKESGVKTELTRVGGVTHGFITMDKITDKADEAVNQISSYLQNEFKKRTTKVNTTFHVLN